MLTLSYSLTKEDYECLRYSDPRQKEDKHRSRKRIPAESSVGLSFLSISECPPIRTRPVFCREGVG